MVDSVFLTQRNAIIGTSLGSPGTGQYPQTDSHMYWPAGVTKSWPSGDLANYNRHKEMWGGRTPQAVRVYNNSPGATTGVTGSAGTYGLISSDWRAIANDGAFLNISFKMGSSGTWQALANNLNAPASDPDNADKQTVRNIAQNLRRWHADTGNTATIKKVILGYWHEPSNDGATAASYKAAFRAIFTYLARRGVIDSSQPLNVPLDGSSAPGGAVTTTVDCIERAFTDIGTTFTGGVNSFFPGADICKWVFADPYNWGGGQMTPNAEVGKVPQPGETALSSNGKLNYTKPWAPLKDPIRHLLDFGDNQPEILLGLGEFACSEDLDQWPVSNNTLVATGPLSGGKNHVGIPYLKGEWYEQIPRLAAGLASVTGAHSENAFPAEPRGKRIRMWMFWPSQAVSPRWWNTVPFQPGDITGPSTTGTARSRTYDGFVAMVNDPWFDVVTGTLVTPPTNLSLTYTVGDTGRDYTFTAAATPGTGTITTFSVDFGDGTAPADVNSATGATLYHDFATDGVYTVRLTVTAGDGGTATITRQVTVTGLVVPDAPATATEPLSGAPYLVPGDQIANLRYKFNPALDRLAAYAYDIATRRTVQQIAGTTYTLSLGDVGKVLEFTSATAVTVTVPSNALVAFPAGIGIDIVQAGDGQVTIAGATGVTVSAAGALTTRARWSRVRVSLRGVTNQWLLSGDITAAVSTAPPAVSTATNDDLFAIDFNEGPSGSAISMTPWTDHPAGVDATYNTDAYEGAFSAQFVTSAQSSYYRKQFTSQSLAWFGALIKIPTAYPAASTYLMSWLNGTVKIGDLRLNTNGTLSIRDNITGAGSDTAAVPLGAWAWVSVKCQPGSATGHELRLYTGTAKPPGTPTSTVTTSATSAAQTSVNVVRLGVVASGTLTYRVDRFRGNSTVEPTS